MPASSKRALIAIFVTVLEDLAALIGLAIAAAGLTLSHLLRAPAIDGVASILIGLILVVEAVLLGAETRGLIIGESVRPLLLDRIREVVAQSGEVGPVSDIRTLQLGPDAVLYCWARSRWPGGRRTDLRPRPRG
jgi:divalent metal cation (Fe/Co/Zn/Cd) transporter